MNEKSLMHQVMLALSNAGARVFRNQVGRYKIVRPDGREQWLTTGLCKGSSDLVGWCPITITQDMVGKRAAIFVACEIKVGVERTTLEQSNFLTQVQEAGGIAFVSRDVNEALRCLERQKGLR